MISPAILRSKILFYCLIADACHFARVYTTAFMLVITFDYISYIYVRTYIVSYASKISYLLVKTPSTSAKPLNVTRVKFTPFNVALGNGALWVANHVATC